MNIHLIFIYHDEIDSYPGYTKGIKGRKAMSIRGRLAPKPPGAPRVAAVFARS
jgi:hypothetical protein